MTDYEKQQLRSAWTGVFLDGKDERGAHVLQLPQGMIEPVDPTDYASEIFEAATQAGHTAFDSVVVVWRWDASLIDGGTGGWDLVVPYHADLTALIYGTPYEQREARQVEEDYHERTVEQLAHDGQL